MPKLVKKKDRMTKVKEGLVTIEMPRSGIGKERGPAQKGPVFFNPAMEFSRDVTIALFPLLTERKRRRVLDGLGGTGVRGIRLALECPGSYGEIVINDVNPKAFQALERNIETNEARCVTATRRHLNSLMHEESFNYIDIDPYGSPVPFLDSAVQAAGRGVVGITATDTAALCGSSPKACLRRYSARAQRSHFMHEAGIRILIGLIVRLAARYDKAATPLLSHATDHYMRTYISLEKGARKAEACLEQMGHTSLHVDGRFQTVTMEEDTHLVPGPASHREAGTLYWGPLWAGRLHDRSFLQRMDIPLAVKKKARLEKAIGIWKGEADLGPMFYDVDELSRQLRPGPPRMDRLLAAIHEEGYKAVRTQFSPKGFKTDMPHAELLDLMKRL